MMFRVVFALVVAGLPIGNTSATPATPAATASAPVPAVPAVPANAGWFGFSVHVSSIGKFEKRVALSVRIDAVAARSPAAAQGLAVGDAIVAIGARKVSGVHISELGALISRAVGEPLQLTIRRDNGEPRDVRLIAVVKPDKPG